MHARPPHSAPAAPVRVLVVDDDVLVRALVRAALSTEDAFHEPLEAASLADADDLIASGGIDCVILSLDLPDGDGAELAQRLRQAGGPPVVVLSQADAPGLAVRLVKAGVEDYLDKAEVEAAEIPRAVRQAMGQQVRGGQVEAQSKLTVLALRDPLTRLPNQQGLAELLERRRGTASWAAVAELDDWGEVVAALGSTVSDGVIREIAGSLREELRHGDVAARVGPARFAMLVLANDEDEAWLLGTRLKDAVDRVLIRSPHLTRSGWGRRFSCSVGLVPMGEGAEDLGALLARLDQPLSAARAAGMDRVVLHRDSPDDADQLSLHTLRVRMRPVYDVNTARRVGAEVCMVSGGEANWLPAVLSRARARGDLDEVELQLLQRRLAVVRRRRPQGDVVLPILIRSLRSPEVLDHLEAAAKDLGWKRLTACVWGEDGATGSEELVALGSELRRRGIGVGLARVGRGQTRVESLLALHPRLLRLERSVGVDIATDAAARRRLARLTHLGRSLGALMLLPGVNDPEVRRTAASLGVDLVASDH